MRKVFFCLLVVCSLITGVACDGMSPSGPTNIAPVAPVVSAPIISDVAATAVETSSAALSWTTDKESDSQVEYGPTTEYGSVSAPNTVPVTSHNVTVEELTQGTSYHFRVRSRDRAGNLATSEDFTFTTLTPPAADETAPISIAGPASGSTVSGTITVAALNVSDKGVAGVQFKLDGANLGPEDVTSPFSVIWDTTTVANGVHKLSAAARDKAGRIRLSTGTTVTVANSSTSDTTPPTASITSPASGATVSGTIPISANADDNVGVAGVQFKLDGANLGAEDTTSPYSVNGDTTLASKGSHTLTAVARDAAGNQTTSAAVAINVNNDAPAPTDPGTVTDLRITATAANSVTLALTEANDGTGSPAKYDVRYAAGTIGWGSAAKVSSGTCSTPLAGTTIGATKSCTVLGLNPSTAYQFQLVPYRGTLDVDAVFGALSNVASGSTTAAAGDTTLPTVSIIAPISGAVVLATVPVAANASDNVGVVGVQFKLDGANLSAEDTTSPYSVNWNTATVANGSHTLTAVARDAAGNTKTSAGVAVTVNNAGGGSSTWPNEPSGFIVVEDTGWEGGTLGSWFKKFTSADKPISVGSITDSLIGESKALQIDYLAGHVGGGGTELQFDIPVAQRSNEIYVGYYVKVNPAWQGHNSAINKMIYLNDGGSSFSAMWYEMFGSGSSPLGLYVVNQSGSGPSGMHENVTPITFTRGQWHKVEIYQKQGASNNGIVRVWVNGVLAINRTDVGTRSTPVDNVTISGIWGGVGDSKNQADYMRFDHIHISRR